MVCAYLLRRVVGAAGAADAADAAGAVGAVGAVGAADAAGAEEAGGMLYHSGYSARACPADGAQESEAQGSGS